MITLRSRTTLGGIGQAESISILPRAKDNASWTEIRVENLRLNPFAHLQMLSNGLKYLLSSAFFTHSRGTTEFSGGLLTARELPPPWQVPHEVSFTWVCDIQGDLPLGELVPKTF